MGFCKSNGIVTTFKKTKTVNTLEEGLSKLKKRQETASPLVMGLFTLGEKPKNALKFEEGLCVQILE